MNNDTEKIANGEELISFSPNSTQPADLIDISVDAFLNGVGNGKWEDDFYRVSKCETKEDRTKVKKETVPLVTISGKFSYRKNTGLIKHSSFIAIDCDNVNPEETKSLLCPDPHVYAAFKSISGTGLCLIIHIDPNKHLESFLGIQEYLFVNYGIAIDTSCKDVSRPRYVSCDYKIYRNSNAVKFERYPKQKLEANKISQYVHEQTEFDTVLKQIEILKLDITGDYHTWLKICFALIDGFPEHKARQYFHKLSSYNPAIYDYDKCNRQFDACLRSENEGVKIASLYWIFKQAGLNISTTRIEHVEEIHEVQFPYKIFPVPVQDFISCQTVQPEPLAVGILSAIGSAIGNTAELYISHGRRAKPILNIVTVAESGQKKSPALDIAYSGITRHDAKLTATFKQSYKRFIKEKKNPDPEKVKNPESEVKAPVHYQVAINNATMAMLVLILSRNDDGCVLKLDELRGLFKKMTDPRVDDLEQWLSLYDGRTIRNQRKGGSGTPEQDLVVENPHCGIVGTTQPGFLKEMFGGQNAENGMLFRFLFCVPDSIPPERPTRRETPQKIIAGFFNFFEAILNRRRLTGEAKVYEISDTVFEVYADWALIHANAAYNDKSKAGFWSKYENTCLRIALILQVMEDSQYDFSVNAEITEGAMKSAMAVMDYFVCQAWKVLNVIRDKGNSAVQGEYEAFYKSLPELFNQGDADNAGKKYGKQPDAIRKRLYKMVAEGSLKKCGIGLYQKLQKTA